MARKPAPAGRIRVGIGGWNYAPWRGVFYPKGLKQADELAYATSHLTSIEINATHYRLQSPKSFRNWAATAPDGFVFSVKGPRLVTQQKVLAETGAFIDRFLKSGLAELGDKLGPIALAVRALQALRRGRFRQVPRSAAERLGRTQAQPRRRGSPSRASTCRASPSCCARSGVTAAYVDAESWPNIADLTGDVVYARLQRGDDALPAAYPPRELDAWAERARIWAQGSAPDDLRRLDAGHQAAVKPRDVFIYFIHEGKLRAPAAAMALIERLRAPSA